MAKRAKSAPWTPPLCARVAPDGRRKLKGEHKYQVSSGGLLCIYCRLHPHEIQSQEWDWPKE